MCSTSMTTIAVESQQQDKILRPLAYEGLCIFTTPLNVATKYIHVYGVLSMGIKIMGERRSFLLYAVESLHIL